MVLITRTTFFSTCTHLQISFAYGKAALISLVIGIITATTYHVLLESSKLQATLGKLLLGIVVTDLQGKRITSRRALVRHLSKYASAFSLGIGYLMYFASKRRQCLHDAISKCVIVQRKTQTHE